MVNKYKTLSLHEEIWKRLGHYIIESDSKTKTIAVEKLLDEHDKNKKGIVVER